MARGNKGYTLIELIIALGIVAIITTGALLLLNQITMADTKKAAKSVDVVLDKLRLDTMAKSSKSYLHIYYYDNGVYIKVSSEEDSILADLDSDSGKKIGRKMSIYYTENGGTEKLLESGESIVISFNRSSGAFSSNYSSIKFTYSGRSSVLQCIKETGRHEVN
jgi:prepilin-type N-terminal cleavage/methylation domain-containing protein